MISALFITSYQEVHDININLSLVRSNLISWLTWCLSGLFTVRLLFFFFRTLSFGSESPSPAHPKDLGDQAIPLGRGGVIYIIWKIFSKGDLSVHSLFILLFIYIKMDSWIFILCLELYYDVYFLAQIDPNLADRSSFKLAFLSFKIPQ